MSVNLKEHKRFILSLLHGDNALFKTLISNSNSRQLSALAEIFYNFGILPLSSEKRQKLQTYKYIFKKYVNYPKQRKSLARKHYKIIKKSLNLTRSFITEILK